MLTELASYTAPDEYTVVFKWKKPYFLALDTAGGIEIQPAHVIARMTGSQYNEAASNPLNRSPIGTGPFKFVRWDSGQKIVLARNDDYWGQKPYLDRLIFRIETDHTVMLQLAERGDIDLVDQVTSDQWQHMDSPVLHTKWNRSKFYANNYAWIGWNEERPFFKDARVRKALTLLVDRPGILDKMLRGLPRPTTCHFYWASSACDPNLKPLPYDPAAARALLDEAGWKDTNNDGVRDKGGVALHFVLMLPVGASEAALWAAKVKEDFAHAGIEMDLQTVEWAAYSKRLREHSFDACTLLWGSTGSRDEPSQIWHSSSIKGGSNYISFKNAEVDKLLEEARVTLDDAARNEMYRKFGAILYAEQPYTWLYVRPELGLLSKKIKGARESLAWWQFERMWIDPSWSHESTSK
jgi:peptide/nickel transport system substrate-binding protein